MEILRYGDLFLGCQSDEFEADEVGVSCHDDVAVWVQRLVGSVACYHVWDARDRFVLSSLSFCGVESWDNGAKNVCKLIPLWLPVGNKDR